MSFLPLSRPSIRAEEIAAVVDVLQSGWITTGAKAAELEQALLRFHRLPARDCAVLGDRGHASVDARDGHRPRR